jgi:hypothetical protein
MNMVFPLTEPCYDNFMHRACVPDGPSNDSLTGGAWVLIIAVVVTVSIVIACWLIARRKENRIIANGGDPYLHIGGLRVRRSTLGLASAICIAEHHFEKHPLIEKQPWKDAADKYSNELYKGINER